MATTVNQPQVPLEEAAYIEFNRIRHKTAFKNSNSRVPEAIKATATYKGFVDGFLGRETANQTEFTGLKAREYYFFMFWVKNFILKNFSHNL